MPDSLDKPTTDTAPDRDRGGTPKSVELAFLPAALEVLETPPRPLARAIAGLIALFFFVALVWAIVGEIDTVAVATGRIVPNERAKVLQPLEDGIVRAIHVRDGAIVGKGDVLVALDATAPKRSSTRSARILVRRASRSPLRRPCWPTPQPSTITLSKALPQV